MNTVHAILQAMIRNLKLRRWAWSIDECLIQVGRIVAKGIFAPRIIQQEREVVKGEGVLLWSQSPISVSTSEPGEETEGR